MKIQLSPTRIVPDAITVWQEAGPDVDIVMDLKNLTFAQNSLEAIFAFHVLDHLFPNEVPVALKNWKKCLKNNESALFVVVDDFEYIARAFVGGDINIELFNEQHSHPTQLTSDNLLDFCRGAGFDDQHMKIWYAEVPNLFKKTDFELVISAEKHDAKTT